MLKATKIGTRPNPFHFLWSDSNSFGDPFNKNISNKFFFI